MNKVDKCSCGSEQSSYAPGFGCVKCTPRNLETVHYIEHTLSGLASICDPEDRYDGINVTSNEHLVTCNECWKMLIATSPPSDTYEASS